MPGSQSVEDAALRALLPQRSGLYIDIGASHPSECSNTWQFYCRGWRGLLVEPLVDCWPDLLRYRMGDILIPVAASDKDGRARLRVSGSVSSLEPDWKISTLRNDDVETMTLPRILRLAGHEESDFQLCSLDVEGHEAKVLSRVDWLKFRPWVFCIEYRDYDAEQLGADRSSQWEPLLLSNGYQLVGATELNKIYLRNDKPRSPAFSGDLIVARRLLEEHTR